MFKILSQVQLQWFLFLLTIQPKMSTILLWQHDHHGYLSGIYGWQAMVISSPDIWWHTEIQPPLLERISWSNGRLIFLMECWRTTILWITSSLGVTHLHPTYWWGHNFIINHGGVFFSPLIMVEMPLHLHHGSSFCTHDDNGQLTREHFCYQVT